MSNIDKYIERMSIGGDNRSERLINRSRRIADKKMESSPSYYLVDIDGEDVGVIVHRTNQYEIKQIHFRYDYDVKVGSVVTFDDKRYLLMEKDRDIMYSFAKMEMCNTTFKIQTGETESVLIGHDDRGRPIYDEIAIYKDEPCIVRDKYYSSNDNAPMPLPEGKLDIFMKYQQANNIAINKEFTLQDKRYKISDISYVGVIDNVGVMRIHAERREDE